MEYNDRKVLFPIFSNMVYETALIREAHEMRDAAKLHPEYCYERLQEFVKEKTQRIMVFTKMLKEQESKCKDIF